MGLFSVASYSMFGFLFAVLASATEDSTTDIVQEEQCQDGTHVNSGVSSSNLSTYSRNIIQEEQCQDTTHVNSGVSSSNASTAAKDCQLSVPEGLFDKINILPDLIQGLISVGNSLLEDPSSSSLEHSQNQAMEFDHDTTPDNLFSSMDRHTSSSPTEGGQAQLLIETEYRNLLSTNCPSTLKLAETEEPHVPNETTSEEPKYEAIGRARVQIPSTGSSSILNKQKHVAEVDDCRHRSRGETGSDCSTRPSVYAVAKRKCIHCGTEDTPLWRKGPDGLKTLCNACGIHYKAAGKLLPEYRPAGSPSFDRSRHSNYYRKIMTKKAGSPP